MSKLLIVDDVWTSVGSCNIDNRSFRINDEANLNVLDPAFAAGQTRIFDSDKAKCRRISLDEWKHRSLLEKLFAPLPALFKTEL